MQFFVWKIKKIIIHYEDVFKIIFLDRFLKRLS